MLDVLERDPYIRLLEVKITEWRPGFAKAKLRIKENMVNFHGITHGGVIFSLADIAFSAACNTENIKAVALNAAVYYLKATKTGSLLTAEAREEKVTGRTGLYQVQVMDEDKDLVASFQGLAYRKTVSTQ